MSQDHRDIKAKLLEAAKTHLAFEGWSEALFLACCADCEIDPQTARRACPRGARDLAVAYHKSGDDQMIAALADEDLGEMRFRDKVARAIWLRIEAAGDREHVRRGSAYFALPQNAAEGAALIWGTADAIWEALGDTSRDINWYSKRAILSAVYGATVLYWLGDESPGARDSRDFIDRRIEDVMRFEKAKAGFRKTPGLGGLASAFERLGEKVRAPGSQVDRKLPGSWSGEIK